MRLRSSSTEFSTPVSHLLSEVSGRGGVRGVRGRIQRFFKGNRSPTNATDGAQSREEEAEELFTLKDYLDQNLFSEASQFLIDEENHLFLQTSESERLSDWKSETEKLHNDHQVLQDAILKTIRLSLDRKQLNPTHLSSAVDALCKELDQDEVWRERDVEKPKWRPSGLRHRHDRELRSLVEERMDNPTAQCSSSEPVQGSSIQADVWGLGRQIKQDLDTVVQEVVRSYPQHFDICRFYAHCFHQAFAARLRKIAEFGLDDKDCTFILRWVHEYYPQILEKPMFSEHIHAEDFGKLLPPTLLQPLEEQYLSKQQSDMLTYIRKVLNEAKQMWARGEMPKTEYGCFISDTAVDITEVVNGAVTSAEKVLADRTKAQSLTALLPELLHSYKSFLDDVIRSNKPTTGPTVKANLHCIQQFSNVLERRSHLFPRDVRLQCESILSEMQQSAHRHLLSPVHAQLKPLYRKLSSAWPKGAQLNKILDDIESKRIQDLEGLTPDSHQELMGRLHVELCVEFVKRMMRGDKLRDQSRQQEAHQSIQRDAEQIHLLFSKLGSQEDWLKDVLIKIAELIKLQDLSAVQLHVVSMAKSYPDISEKHVSAILKLKSNFTKTNRQTVKETLRDMHDPSSAADDAHLFFSLVPV